MRVDETGRQYTDVGIGEHGQQILVAGITSIGRKILLSGALYTKTLTDTLTVACAMGNNIIDKYILEPVTLIITKPVDLVKKAYTETVNIYELAIKELTRTYTLTATVTPSVFPSMSKILIETLTITNTIIKNITHKIIQSAIVTPSIFRSWISTKVLTQTVNITATGYKNLTKTLNQTVNISLSLIYGFYMFCSEAVNVSAIATKRITHRLIESTKMITEYRNMFITVIRRDSAFLYITARKQPEKLLTEAVTILDYIKHGLTIIIIETFNIIDSFKPAFMQHCDEIITIACTMGNNVITKLAVEVVELIITKPINLTRKIIQVTNINALAHAAQNIFLYLVQTIHVNPFVNGKYIGLALFTAKQTVDKVISKQTLADVKTAAVYKVGHVGSQLDSMKKATITTLKKKTGIFKLGDEQS